MAGIFSCITLIWATESGYASVPSGTTSTLASAGSAACENSKMLRLTMMSLNCSSGNATTHAFDGEGSITLNAIRYS